MGYLQQIASVHARQIIDSRGNPTVECAVTLEDGSAGLASVPSGASTGSREAVELRDHVDKLWKGKGVMTAVLGVNREIAHGLVGMDASNIPAIDHAMRVLDATADKRNLGANAILAVSLAASRAMAASTGLSLYQFLGGCDKRTLPVPLLNIINGGLHASNNLDIQEFMIVPVGAPSYRDALRWSCEVYHTLGDLLRSRGQSTAVGAEGGFAPDLASNEEAIQWILEAISLCGYQPGKQFMIALDAAASGWKTAEGYTLPKQGRSLSCEELISYWDDLSRRYPVVSIEDPLGEEDWPSWQELTRRIGDRVQLVGDDLFVTNPGRIRQGIQKKAANAALIKPNQIGTLTETLEAVSIAQNAGYRAVISHRSGETEDSFIADLAVATAAGQIKAGAPCRSDRTAKYNRLLRIEEHLGRRARYAGREAFACLAQQQ